jgi:hypothetical protein
MNDQINPLVVSTTSVTS